MTPVEALTQIRDLCDASDVLGPREFRSRVRAVLDAVSVDATPAQGIDRDALDFILDTMLWNADGSLSRVDFEAYLDRILALVRPVEGVLLSREKARWVISDTLMRVYDNGTSPNAAREAQAVLDDLEAAEKP